MAQVLDKDRLLRTNSAVMLTLVGGGLVVCALGAAVFDIGRWLAAW